MANVTTDVLIVGAGPIGLEMAVALKRAGVNYLHVDARQIGHTISWFAPQTRFFSSSERIAIAGVPLQTPDGAKCTREQYLAYVRGVAQQFDLQVNTYEPVTEIDPVGTEGFDVSTRAPGGARRYRCNKLILATGGTDRPRRLKVPGEDLPHVSHYFNDPHTYFRKRVMIIGGKNSAVEAALRCHNAGANVSISYRRERLPEKSIKYWLLPEINHLIETRRIRAAFNTVPVAISPTRVTLMPANAGAAGGGAAATTEDIHTDFVLALIGYEQDTTLFKLAGVELKGECNAPSLHEQTMESTSVRGIYVIGTAVAGTQDKYTLFIENCHVHVPRVLAAITGKPADAAASQVPAEVAAQPES